MGFICEKCGGKHTNYKDGFCPVIKILKEFSPKKVDLNFSGTSPPELFVGRFNYPNVFTGILAPPEYNDNVYKLSSPEEWFKNKLNIEDILAYRSYMVYSRFTNNIKNKSKLLETMQEISMSKKSVNVEFNLKKKPKISLNLNNLASPIGNPAPLIKARIEENTKIDKKIDYVVSDFDLKAKEAIINLYKNNFEVSNIIKLLSAGLLGIKKNRKLVPTRWSITAVDNNLSDYLIKKIKGFQWVNEFYVFSGEYVGNHYEILIFPNEWSFEVIEAKLPALDSSSFWQDYENYFGRKKYASDVTGAYYANRLAVCEFLNFIKKQGSVLIFREISEEYWAPLGVGILRELSRDVFKVCKKFDNLKEALKDIQTRLKLNMEKYCKKSNLLNNYKKQGKLSQFIS